MIALSVPLDTEAIINVPAMVRAWHVQARTDEWVFVVMASVLVRFTDEVYAPVLATLALLDVQSVRVETLYDPLFMNHRVMVRAYRVAGVRPAQTIPGPGSGPPELRQERVA